MMRDMKDAEFRVIIAICRKTFGWQKKKDLISISQLSEITGLSRQGVINGTSDAIEDGIIKRTKFRQSFIYELVLSSQPGLPDESELVNEVDQLDEELVNKVDIQKKEVIKEISTQGILESVTGIPVTDVNSLLEIEKLEPIKEDIQEAYKWLCSKKEFKYYGQLIGPIQTAMNRRLRKKPEYETEAIKGYSLL
jgi:phage replication O-like protein O